MFGIDPALTKLLGTLAGMLMFLAMALRFMKSSGVQLVVRSAVRAGAGDSWSEFAPPPEIDGLLVELHNKGSMAAKLVCAELTLSPAPNPRPRHCGSAASELPPSLARRLPLSLEAGSRRSILIPRSELNAVLGAGKAAGEASGTLSIRITFADSENGHHRGPWTPLGAGAIADAGAGQHVAD